VTPGQRLALAVITQWSLCPILGQDFPHLAGEEEKRKALVAFSSFDFLHLRDAFFTLFKGLTPG